ncbi:MAG: hypothetical protein J5881_01900 [Clostridia bacterium]|nr:hypothetical protein [Clostridia bacterium]
MSIIYSRPRLRLPKFIFYKNKRRADNVKHKRQTKLIIIVFIAFATLKLVLDAVEPVFTTLCENKAISLATIISNKKATEIMKEHTYDELFTVEKNEDGTVSFLKANVVQINQITSDVAVRIQEEINKQGRDEVGIALRNLYRHETFSWAWSNNSYKNIINRKCEYRIKK